MVTLLNIIGILFAILLLLALLAVVGYVLFIWIGLSFVASFFKGNFPHSGIK